LDEALGAPTERQPERTYRRAEGRNVRIEERWANSDYAVLPALAAELVAKGVVVIAATGDVASARAAQAASSTVPVVFTIGGDPVRFGLVKSVNRPGGNVTGILFNQNVLGGKRVELLREIAPKVSRIALLMNPTNPNVDVERKDAEVGARKLGLETIEASDELKEQTKEFAGQQFEKAKKVGEHAYDTISNEPLSMGIHRQWTRLDRPLPADAFLIEQFEHYKVSTNGHFMFSSQSIADLEVALRPAVFYPHVLAFDEAGLIKTTPQHVEEAPELAG
jgi:hypothetical protein